MPFLTTAGMRAAERLRTLGNCATSPATLAAIASGVAGCGVSTRIRPLA